MAGDAVHNARSALDHLAWGLVIRDGGAPTRYTAFPIAKDALAGNKAINGENLKGVRGATREMVRALQPWAGGDDKLWRLHQLDIHDKHKLLIRIGVTNRAVWIKLPGMPKHNPVTGEPIDPLYLELLEAEPLLLTNGDEVYRVMKAARQSVGEEEAASHLQGFTLDVALADEELVVGDSLAPVLTDLVTHAEAAVQPLISLLPEHDRQRT